MEGFFDVILYRWLKKVSELLVIDFLCGVYAHSTHNSFIELGVSAKMQIEASPAAFHVFVVLYHILLNAFDIQILVAPDINQLECVMGGKPALCDLEHVFEVL